MTYDSSIPTDMDYVRFRVGDVYPADEFLTDTEIQFLLDLKSDRLLAASAAADAIASRAARNTDYRFSTLWDSASQAHAHYKQLARDLEFEASATRGTKFELIQSRNREAMFDIGMHDNTG